MSELSKQQLGVENSTSFPNNNTGYITPAILRTFNQNMIDSLVDEVSYNADSASWEADIQQLQQFSSSLDANFVTAAELNQSSSTLQSNINAKLNTSSFNAYTASQEVISASFNTRINSITASIPAGTVSSSAQIVGLGFLQTSSFNQFTQSYKSDSGSFDSRIVSLTSATSSYILASQTSSMTVASASRAVSSSFAITASFALNATGVDTGSLVTTSSFNAYTQSAASNVSGAINTATGSSLVTASISGDIITFTKGNGSTFPIQVPVASGSVPAGTVSSSAQIAELGYATTSSVSQSVSALNAATSSYITSAQTSSMTVLSASFAQTASFLSGSVASASFATSASFAVTSSLAQNVVIIARNGNASTLAAGTIVHITGASGDNPIFNTASYDTELLSANTLGVLRQSAAPGADVDVLVNGIVTGVNTDPANGYVAGDIIYLSSSGQFTRILPQAPNQVVTIGQVLRAQQNNGSVYVNINNGWELNELHNVAINGEVDGDLLVYRSGSGLWTNSSSIELGNATTGSNTFIGNQIISGNLLVTGSNINLEVDAPALTVGTTNVKTIADMTASGVVSSLDVTRLGAGPTGDLTSIRIQTLSGSDTAGDTLLSRFVTNVNRHTSTAMTGSVVNTILTAQWATGSAGGRVNYQSQITANAQSASATLTLSAGAGATNAGGTASLAAGLIRIGGNSAHRIAPTGSFTNITIDTADNTLTAFSIKSGSFEVTTPQGSGSFYSNLPITSSAIRSNGTLIAKDLIVSGTFGGTGSGSLQVENNASISGSLLVSGAARFSGSVQGDVKAITIVSTTASIDCSLGNFFTVTLANGTNHISATNIRPGQTINLRVTTVSGNAVTCSSAIKQPSGSAYTPTNASGTDILTFVGFDTTNLFMVSVKNLI